MCILRYERFKDNTQQDSSELLRCLLDGIRKEEIQVKHCLYIAITYTDLSLYIHTNHIYYLVKHPTLNDCRT